jgi:hypothetical protein
VKHNPPDDDIRKNFWSLVDKNGPLPDPATGVRTKCWLWLGSVTDQGYGRFKAGGEMYMARRFAWLEMGKPDPDALTVSTRCENRLCLRHLDTRTRAEVMASVSHRWASGENSHLGSHHLQASAPDPQALQEGQRYPERVGRALRHLNIKRE